MTGGGEGLPVSPALFFALFAVVFPFFWLAVIALIANLGWRRVACAYPAASDPPLSARRWRFVSLNIGGSMRSPNYGSSVERERRLVGERVRVKLAGEVPDLLFVGALGRALLDRLRNGAKDAL